MPTFVDPELYLKEFASDDERMFLMLQKLAEAVDRALATAAGDQPVVEFQYWRKLSAKATKMKPLDLRGTLYMNPDYGVVWLLVELA